MKRLDSRVSKRRGESVQANRHSGAVGHGVLVGACCLALLLATSTQASRLPIRPYTTKDGLPHDAAWRIKRDSNGFLWFCTPEGLSRFDGKVFVNYGPANGMPATIVEDVVEAPDGTFRVALAWPGIARFDPDAGDPEKLFTALPLGAGVERTTALTYDRRGTLWIGTLAGLYTTAGAENIFAAVDLESDGVPARPRIWRLLADRAGNLWVATSVGLVVLAPDGRVGRRAMLPDDAPVEVYELIQDDLGRIWAGHDRGVTVLVAAELDETVTFGSTLPASAGESAWYGVEDGVGDGLVAALHQTSDGAVWLAPMKGGLTEFDGARFHHLRPGDGPGAFLGRGFAEDVEGNLWIGSLDRGAMRLARTGLTAFDENDGLEFSSNAAIAQDAEGGIVVVAGSALYGFDGSRFVAVHPRVLASHRTGRTGENAAALQDSRGRWWLGTPSGLYRFATGVPLAGLDRATPDAVFSTRNGLPGDQVTALLESRDGSFWIAPGLAGQLARLRVDTLEVFGTADGLPPAAISALGEDAHGALWVGSSRGLARLRGGAFERIDEGEGASVTDIFADTRGRLWLATRGGGVLRVDDPGAVAPMFSRLTAADGLASDFVRAIAEDAQGKIYFGTSSGLDRYDPDTESLRHYRGVHGLSNEEIQMALRDRAGALWFTSRRGVTRLLPGEDRSRPRSQQDVRLTGLRIADVEQPLSELGERQIEGLRIAPDRNRVQIEFRGIDFGLDDDRRYEYKLEGADREWSVPVASGEVNYARLAPGRYRFSVRPVGEESTATVGFEILPPFWQRAWFLVFVAAALAGAIYAVHRYRLTRVLEIERVRMRIATDLHDDIGASLSQISILSEVARRDRGGGDASLARIAGISRELVDSMSDIVWAINPKRDRIDDLVQRMRRFASDTLSAKDIDFDFEAPAGGAQRPLGADVRRQVYLVLKESVHNAARHSGCSRVRIDFRVAGDRLTLRIEDDGHGFAGPATGEGHGLESMRRRAEGLGGTLDIVSGPGRGTIVRLDTRLGAPPPVQVGRARRAARIIRRDHD